MNMQYFTVQGATPREALNEMKRLYGVDARIHSHRAVRIGGFLGLFARDGVEITGYVDTPRVAQRPQSSPPPAAAATESQSLEEVKQKILDQTRSGQSFQRLVEEISTLRERLEDSIERGASRTDSGAEEHPTIAELRDLLVRNDFAPHYVARLVDGVRDTFSLRDLEDAAAVQLAVACAVGRDLQIGEPLAAAASSKAATAATRVFIVVGPTGVGKTTTVAKLAAIHGIGVGGRPARAVRIITIDNYRIAARQQIETYGEIMRIPVTAAESSEELQKAVALGDGADLVLIDTIGKSPRDYARLGEMRAMLAAAGNQSSTHLAISATTKYADVDEILRQYEPFGYDSVIVTKLDETSTIGNVLSALAERRKPVSYVCDGQVVPQDIEPASTIRLLTHLDGFKLDRLALEQAFGPNAEPPPERARSRPQQTGADRG